MPEEQIKFGMPQRICHACCQPIQQSKIDEAREAVYRFMEYISKTGYPVIAYLKTEGLAASDVMTCPECKEPDFKHSPDCTFKTHAAIITQTSERGKSFEGPVY